MNKAAFGEVVSTYHIEAAIAYEHCSAKSFKETNWKKILNYYEWLCKISHSPINELNKVVAVMELYGAAIALEELESIKEKKKLESYYLYHSLLGEIYSRLDNLLTAREHFEAAVKLTQSETERKMLINKILALSH